jgi:hypothetical protein
MNASNTTVVISRHQKDVSWTQKFVQNGFHVIVYDHNSHGNHPYYISSNNGREASVYLKYIVDYYESLSTYTVFLQDDDTSWHHRDSIVDLVLARLGKRSKYYNLNKKCLGIIQSNDLWPTMRKFFAKYMAPYIGDIEQYGEFTPGFKCCAQFIVHSDRVREHPKKMYEGILKYVVERPDPGTPNPQQARGHMLEWTWHLLFDNPFAPYNKDKKKPAQFRAEMEDKKNSILRQKKSNLDNRRKARLNGCDIL